MEVVLEVVNSKRGIKITAEELREYYLHFPDDQLWIYNINDMFFSRTYMNNKEALLGLRNAQADKDFIFQQ